ncbi:MAG: hypothetical protein GX981_02650 [Tissierellia bacterium]|nr:hypothetical protein [Tissierellia bacterium]
MSIYREIISKDLDIDHISDRELASILDDMGRGIIYEHLLFGRDFTYKNFIEILQLYLGVLDKLD